MIDARHLPAAVLERLSAHPMARPAGQWWGLDTVQRNRVLEARSAKVELRRTDDGDPVLDGYATVYEYPYDVAGGPPWGWTEVIASGATTKSIRERDDVRLLFNHEGVPLARTKSKTLTLVSDDIGLHTSTPQGMDMLSPWVQTLASAMERGDLDEMSFAFECVRQEWNEDYTERRVLEARLWDVSVVTYPANPAAIVQLRDLAPPPAPPADDAPRLGLAYARALAATL